MKTKLHPLIAICATLLPFTQLQAAETLATKFGGFEAGKKFTLTVSKRISVRTSGTKVTKGVPVPAGIPDFRDGDDVNFTIGASGQLKGDEFSIVYRSSRYRTNLYSNNPSGFNSDGQAASVSKSSTGRPISAKLVFYTFRFSGFTPITNTVTYFLD
jgi:hypothetical protein